MGTSAIVIGILLFIIFCLQVACTALTVSQERINRLKVQRLDKRVLLMEKRLSYLEAYIGDMIHKEKLKEGR